MSTPPVVRIEVFSPGPAQSPTVVVGDGAAEGAQRAQDFPTLEAAARQMHASHVWTDVDNGTTWIFWKDRAGAVTKSEVFRADGKYHVSGRWWPATLPRGARSLAAEDYVAIGSSGKIVGGPFKYYEHAKKEADAQGGYVRFAMEIVADYEAIDAKGKRIAGPFKHYDQAKKEADARGGLVRYAFESPLDAAISGLSAISQLRRAPAQMASEGVAEPASKREIDWATSRARAAVVFTYGTVSSVKLLEVTRNHPHDRGFRFSARAVPRGQELIVDVTGTAGQVRVINPKTGLEKVHVSELAESPRMTVRARKLKLALEIADEYAKAVERGEPSYAKVLAKAIDDLGIGRPAEVQRVMKGEGKRKLTPVAREVEKRYRVVKGPHKGKTGTLKPLRGQVYGGSYGYPLEIDGQTYTLATGDVELVGKGARARETAPIVHEGKRAPGNAAASAGASPPAMPYIKCQRDEAEYRKALAAAKRMGPVRSATDVYRVMHSTLGKEDQEVFGVLLFDVRNQCIGWHECARGARDHVEVPLAQIFAPVVQYKPHHYLVVHNHPTGTSDPSKADLDLTDRIIRGAEPWANDSSFVDHVILGVDECYSINHKKKFKIAPPSKRTKG